MSKDTLEIGLALSGGGVRAAVFHLGVLGRLADEQLLEHVTFLSTVSGGSLGIGLVFAASSYTWPTSNEFLRNTYRQVRYYLMHTDIQRDAVRRLATRPWLLFQGRAKLISESIQQCWHISGLLKDMPTEPRWIINATAYETGKNWRFMPQRMGDYLLNYVLEPTIPLADAMAASAAYPGLIGPLILQTNKFHWSRFVEESAKITEPVEPQVKRIHLWDGAIYDNLGVEALFKPHGRRFRDEFNFLMVSDASQGLKMEELPLSYRRALRLVNIAMDQVRSLRARSLISFFTEHPNSGVYLRIGNTAKYILQAGAEPEELVSAVASDCLSEQEVKIAAGLETTLRQLSAEEFDRLYRHGWEVANYTLQTYCKDVFTTHIRASVW